MMKLNKFRSAICYKICGRIGVFALPFAFILLKWCLLVGGGDFWPAVAGLLTLVPYLVISTLIFIVLSLTAYVQSTEIPPEKIKTNLVADIGYVMYIILLLSGLFILGSKNIWQKLFL